MKNPKDALGRAHLRRALQQESAVQAIRDRLTLDDHIGLAIRRHRRALGVSQRAAAVRSERSSSQQARLEVAATRLPIGTVDDAVREACYALVIVSKCDAAKRGDSTSHWRDSQVFPWVAASFLGQALAQMDLSVREAARRSGSSARTVQRVLAADPHTILGTLCTVLRAVGGDVGLAQLAFVGEREHRLVTPLFWTDLELLPRVRMIVPIGQQPPRTARGQRRFPGHIEIIETPNGPRWWDIGARPGHSIVETPQWSSGRRVRALDGEPH